MYCFVLLVTAVMVRRSRDRRVANVVIKTGTVRASVDVPEDLT